MSNAAITCLLRFLKVFVRAFGRAYSGMPLHHVLDSVPSNADNAHRYVWGCKGSTFFNIPGLSSLIVTQYNIMIMRSALILRAQKWSQRSACMFLIQIIHMLPNGKNVEPCF